MKSQKNIAILNILLIGGVLLCLSGYLKAEQLPVKGARYALSASNEQLTAGEHAFPVAWSEPTAPTRATTPVDPVLCLLPPMCGTQAQRTAHLNRKPFRALFGTPTLTRQFRILPNAP